MAYQNVASKVSERLYERGILMKKAALSVMIITILSKVLGFGREVVLSYTYGASGITDGYLISQTVPSVIFGFISAGVFNQGI